MPRFVLLEHDHPVLHWDLMLEWGDALKTWRLDRIPQEPGSIDAVPLPDHRRVYLDYEGPVSGNRGNVQRIDSGTFKLIESSAVTGNAPLTFQLAGQHLRGRATVTPSDSNDDTATLHWEPF
ncbi:MAG: DNA polymerase ligase N-terminal domain-containing protein [Planctomycetota bacterium]|jgi:hypothetical protein